MSIDKIPHVLPPISPAERAAYDIVSTLRSNGYEAFTVGGAVRDRLLERIPDEVDVATNATPEDVQRVFPRTYAVGAAFGVVIVLTDDIQTEVATFRIDGGYVDGRRPSSVSYSDAKNDAERRDFTINALFYDPEAGEIIDFVGGLADLQVGRIRAIGEASRRFNEDHLRMLRAARFAARFRFQLDGETAAAIQAAAAKIKEISAERLFAELNKMLVGNHPHEAFQRLDDLGLLVHVLPEIAAMKGVKQPPQFHPEGDVFAHTLLLLEHMAHPSSELAWAVLLHDVGKPPTFAIGPHGRETFPCHAAVGAEMTEDILRRFRCAKHFIEDVRVMVYHHMSFADVQKMRPATRRRMMARPTFRQELELHRIDCMACHGKLDNYSYMLDCLYDCANEPELPAPLLTGKDVLAHGLTPGPEIGRLLKAAEEQQLNGVLNCRDEALAWLNQELSNPDLSR